MKPLHLQRRAIRRVLPRALPIEIARAVIVRVRRRGRRRRRRRDQGGSTCGRCCRPRHRILGGGSRAPAAGPGVDGVDGGGEVGLLGLGLVGPARARALVAAGHLTRARRHGMGTAVRRRPGDGAAEGPPAEGGPEARADGEEELCRREALEMTRNRGSREGRQRDGTYAAGSRGYPAAGEETGHNSQGPYLYAVRCLRIRLLVRVDIVRDPDSTRVPASSEGASLAYQRVDYSASNSNQLVSGSVGLDRRSRYPR